MRLRGLPIGFVFLATCALAGEDASSVAQTLRDAGAPISIVDLPSTYRAISMGDGLLRALNLGGGYGSAAAVSSLYRLMGVAWVDPEEWDALLGGRTPRIRAYTVDLPRLSDAAFAKDPNRAPLLRERWIERSGVARWSAVPGLGPKEVRVALTPFVEAKWRGKQTAALSQLKQIGTAVMIYQGDTKDRFPRVDSTAAAQRALNPYLRNARMWTTENPNGGRILFNVALSGVLVTALADVAAVPVAWEESAWPDGRRAVVYADGHAKRLSAEAWNAVWKKELARRTKAAGTGKGAMRLSRLAARTTFRSVPLRTPGEDFRP